MDNRETFEGFYENKWKPAIEKVYRNIFLLFYEHQKTDDDFIINLTNIPSDADETVLQQHSDDAAKIIFDTYAELREEFRKKFLLDDSYDPGRKRHDLHRISAMFVLAVFKNNIFFLKDNIKEHYIGPQTEQVPKNQFLEKRKTMFIFGKEYLAWVLIENIFKAKHQLPILSKEYYPQTQSQQFAEKEGEGTTYVEYALRSFSSIHKNYADNFENKNLTYSYLLNLAIYFFHFDQHLANLKKQNTEFR